MMKIIKTIKASLMAGVLSISLSQAQAEASGEAAVLTEKGIFLQETKKDYREAFEVYEKALELAEDNLSRELLYRMVVSAELSGDEAKKKKVKLMMEARRAPFAVRGKLNVLLNGIKNNDLELFVSVCDPGMQAAMNKEMLTNLSAQMSAKMKLGYEINYMGSVDRGHLKQYFWMMRYKNSEAPEFMVDMSLDEVGRVAGCYLK